MLIGSFPKQPIEVLPVDIDYSKVIEGRTVSSITTIVLVPSGMTKASEQIAGEVLQLYVAGGTDGMSYRWVATTSIIIGGKTTVVQDEFDVVISEVSNT